uniref:NYN domain-containing protein n=1 Tax=Peronospora matthiolae TaxID=2874970 RepID=A0AAV1VLH6_9STRA
METPLTGSGSTPPSASPPSAMETTSSSRTALIIDGSYAMIGARSLGGKIDYVKLRSALEEQALTQFGDCWFFDQNPSAQRVNPALTAEYHMLKFAPPDGPQFQVSLFPMKKYGCHCRRCGNLFTQNVQKGVDNGIATKILSLAYEDICDRFILFAGDGDFYSSLSHVRNVLRKDIWVMGYRGTVSGDLQQLASRVIWMDSLWSKVKSSQHDTSSYDQGRRDEGRKDRGRRDEVPWFEDHQGEDFHHSDASSSSFDEGKDAGSGRHVVIAPRSNQWTRRRGRGRDWRSSGRGRSKHGWRRSRSRSKERPRGEQSNNAVTARNDAATTGSQSGTAKREKVSSSAGRRGADGKRRKRNGTDKNGQKRSRQEACGDKRVDGLPVITLSDFSSDEDVGEAFPSAVPLESMTKAPFAAQDRDSVLDEVIDLALDSESE